MKTQVVGTVLKQANQKLRMAYGWHGWNGKEREELRALIGSVETFVRKYEARRKLMERMYD